MVGLLDLATSYLKSGVGSRLAEVRVKDKASAELFNISQDVTVFAAVRTMLDRHARRLFVTGPGLVLSDRSVIKWLLSPSNVTKLKDSPKQLMATTIGSISEVLHAPSFVSPDTDGTTALELILKNDAHCVITEDLKHILTPWDLTVKLLVE